MPTSGNYGVRTYRDSDEGAVVHLLCQRFDGWQQHPDPTAMFRWKHLHNPFGRSLMSVVEYEGHVIAFRAFMRWEFRQEVSGATIRALRGADAVTHQQHARRGLWEAMTRQGLDRAHEFADLAIAHGNERSRAGYSKLGWERIGCMTPLLSLGRPQRRVRSSTAGGGLPFSTLEVDLLRCRDGHPKAFSTDPSPSYLGWRYGALPYPHQEIVEFDVPRGGRGVVVGWIRQRGRIAEFRIGDTFLTKPHDAALRAALRACRRLDVDVVSRSTSQKLALHQAVRKGGLPIHSRRIEVLAHWLVPSSSRPSWNLLDLSLGDMETFF